jgi:hypothetical protein
VATKPLLMEFIGQSSIALENHWVELDSMSILAAFQKGKNDFSCFPGWGRTISERWKNVFHKCL